MEAVYYPKGVYFCTRLHGAMILKCGVQLMNMNKGSGKTGSRKKIRAASRRQLSNRHIRHVLAWSCMHIPVTPSSFARCEILPSNVRQRKRYPA